MEIRIIREPVSRSVLSELAMVWDWAFVKAVVDVERGIMAIGGEMHVDEEQALLEDGSRQEDLWGINLYPAGSPSDWIEYDSMINLRPRQNNRSRGVEDAATRDRIEAVVKRLITD